eukprot:2518894-Pyramimonas_sp.AAC.1
MSERHNAQKRCFWQDDGFLPEAFSEDIDSSENHQTETDGSAEELHSFAALPHDALMHCSRFLQPVDLVYLSLTNTDIRKAVFENEMLWVRTPI